jgi:hypothetical protein
MPWGFGGKKPLHQICNGRHRDYQADSHVKWLRRQPQGKCAACRVPEEHHLVEVEHETLLVACPREGINGCLSSSSFSDI